MPDDEKTTISRVVEPVVVAMVGTGDGRMLPTGTEAVTKGSHQPNIVVQVVTPLVAILIRFANAYLTMLVGLITAGMTTDIIPAGDFFHLLKSCAQLSLAGAGLGLLKDAVTIFARLEQRWPLSTGSV